MIYDRCEYKINNVSMIEKVKKKKYLGLEPYHCKKCNKVWQVHQNTTMSKMHSDSFPEYLTGFPKIGCTKRICKNCKYKHDMQTD